MTASTSRTWYLVRHGETEWNAAARMQGQLDSPLTARGRAQAAANADLLARLGVDLIFASPLGRVRASVVLMQAQLPQPVVFDARLMEWSAGRWSGELYAEIGLKWPLEWAAWEADRVTATPPDAETFLDLRARAAAFVADIDRVTAGRRVAIIAHGFINRALAGVLLAQPPTESVRIRQDNDTVIRIVERKGLVLADYFAHGTGPIPGTPQASPHATALA